MTTPPLRYWIEHVLADADKPCSPGRIRQLIKVKHGRTVKYESVSECCSMLEKMGVLRSASGNYTLRR